MNSTVKTMCRSRGLFVFLLGLMIGLVGLTYWHARRVVVPELARISPRKLQAIKLTHRVHTTRIDPDSVVLHRISQEKNDTKPKKHPTTIRPTKLTSPGNGKSLFEQSTLAPVKDPSQIQYSQTSNDTSWPSTQQLLDLIPKPKAQNANCEKIFDNDADEIKKVFESEEKDKKVPVPDEEYANLAKNCDEFKKSRGYISHALSKEEEEFPIAYSIMMFKDIEMVERLLRAIYMPQNYYCIHVDAKSSPTIHKSMKAIVDCFDNVFLASRQVDVQWASFSVLEADLICMEDMYIKSKKWRYFINLTGQEFPIKTNLELVQILKIFNGAVNMEGTEARRNVERTELVHDGFYPVEPSRKKSPVPHNVRLTKGSVHVVVPREFVEYVIFSPIAKDFREWVKDSGVPDETFFTSLGHSPHLGVPGAFKGSPETNKDTYPFLARYKNWGTWPFDFPCAGQRQRMVCITSVGDLYLIKSRPELFVNKFYIDYSPSAYDCLEEAHFQHIQEGLLGSRKLDLEFYKKLQFTWNHV